MKRARPDADVEGAPRLELRDEDLESVAELLSDALIAAMEREHVEDSA